MEAAGHPPETDFEARADQTLEKILQTQEASERFWMLADIRNVALESATPYENLHTLADKLLLNSDTEQGTHRADFVGEALLIAHLTMERYQRLLDIRTLDLLMASCIDNGNVAQVQSLTRLTGKRLGLLEVNALVRNYVKSGEQIPDDKAYFIALARQHDTYKYNKDYIERQFRWRDQQTGGQPS